MSWVRLDDGFADNPKIERLSHVAFRVHVTAMCTCARKLTDGELTAGDVRGILASLRAGPRYIRELTASGLWTEHESVSGFVSYRVRDWLDYNPPADTIREQRKRQAERMRALRAGERAPNVQANVRTNVRRTFTDPLPPRTRTSPGETQNPRASTPRPFKCPHCIGLAYPTQRELTAHLENLHDQAGA